MTLLPLAWLLGVAVQLQQALLSPVWLYALVSVLGLLCIRRWPVLCLLLVAWGSTGLRSAWFVEHALPAALEGRDIEVVGVVDDMPRVLQTGTRFRLAVQTATLQGQAVQVPPLLDVAWYTPRYSMPASDGDGWSLQRAPMALQPGDRWRMTVRLKRPHGLHNPHGFDYELYLWEQGVQATGYVRTGARDPVPELLDHSFWRAPVASIRTHLRERVMTEVADKHSAGLIAALVLGDQAAIEPPDWDVYRNAGLSHLISISGLHVTMFAWLAARLVAWGWRRSVWLCERVPTPLAAAWGGLLLAAAYCALAGWGVPAQRTLWMLAVAVLLRVGGVRWPWYMVLLCSAAAVALLDPWALLQAGFWLSFVAVAVLILTEPVAVPAAHRWPARLRAHAGALLRQQGVVTLALAPLSIGLFGQLSLVGMLANLWAIPWVTLVLTPLSLLGVVWSGFWAWADVAARWMHATAQAMVAWPWASMHWAVPPLPLLVLALLGACVLVLPLPYRVRALGLPPLLAMLLWQPVRPAQGEFALLAADIGQGNAVLVRTVHHSLLYDAGPRYSEDSDAGTRVINPLLQAMGERLDMLVLSHRDTDHVGGAAAVLQQQSPLPTALLSSLEAEHPLLANRPQAQRCLAGQQWEWDGVRFEVLHPRADDYDGSPKPNSLSCVLRISSAQGAVAMLVGDIEAAQERRLLADLSADKLQAQVLLVPHHGSKTSSTQQWVQAVHPQWAWIQAGYRNRYGHPVDAVVQRYRELGSDVVLSSRCGAMSWSSQAPHTECSRITEQRYWQYRE